MLGLAIIRVLHGPTVIQLAVFLAGQVVSLEISGIVVSLEIPISRIFSRKISRKLVKNRFFGLRGPK